MRVLKAVGSSGGVALAYGTPFIAMAMEIRRSCGDNI